MQQAHLERPFVLGTEGEGGFLEELPYVRLKPYLLGRLSAAGCPGLQEHAVPYLAGAGKALLVLEAVVAPEATDGLAFCVDKPQPGMLLDALAQIFQLAVDAPGVECRVEGCRVEEDVDVFREPLDEVPALGQA